MAKIIFDDSVIISQGRDMLDSVVPHQCICINWKTDGYHQTWFGIPDNYEVRMDADGDIHVEKKETYFTGKIVVTPYIIREQASGANKKVPQNNGITTLIVDDGKICSGYIGLSGVICAKFGRLIDNADTRTAIEACIREEFYKGSAFRYYSGITIEWKRKWERG